MGEILLKLVPRDRNAVGEGGGGGGGDGGQQAEGGEGTVGKRT